MLSIVKCRSKGGKRNYIRERLSEKNRQRKDGNSHWTWIENGVDFAAESRSERVLKEIERQEGQNWIGSASL